MPRMTSVGESKLFGENATRRGDREKREHYGGPTAQRLAAAT